ncbi:MAG: hypothetical protein AAF388_00490 [Bacteroidota bacterium]
MRTFICIGMGILLAGILLTSCETEIDANAPEKDIWVVYGVLNPDSEVQYVRISRGFLPEGDAAEFYASNDLSAKGLTVSLTGINTNIIGEEVDTLLTDAEGVAFPNVTLYRFRTTSFQQLQGGRTYQLSVTDPADENFELTASTRIPEEVRILSPRFIPGPGQTRCLQQLALEGPVEISFTRPDLVGGFELRAFLEVETQTGTETLQFGPTALFNDNVSCSGGNSSLCYQFSAQRILESFQTDLNRLSGPFTYAVNEVTTCNQREEDLPAAVQLETTAVDTALTNYLRANRPLADDLNSVRPEYTNIQGDVLSFGVFGSVNSVGISAALSSCTEYLLGLNNTEKPEGCDE